mmetsp:Transcript_5923/g.18214  ORF Transcript_5923/g.18214 Transcript_5923/m.18214 type:complete len:114 (-) Transcript_5923:135-476(-)
MSLNVKSFMHSPGNSMACSSWTLGRPCRLVNLHIFISQAVKGTPGNVHTRQLQQQSLQQPAAVVAAAAAAAVVAAAAAFSLCVSVRRHMHRRRPRVARSPAAMQMWRGRQQAS